MKCLICDKTDLEPDTGRVCLKCARLEHRRLREIPGFWALLPLAIEPGASAGQRVGGTREAPLPLRVDPLDLAMPARVLALKGGLMPATKTIPVDELRTVAGEPGLRLARVQVTERHRRDPKTDQIVDTWHEIAYLSERVTGDTRVPLRWLSDGRRRLTPTDDQAGYPSVETVLDAWIRAWRWHRNAGEGLPEADVPTMVLWLRNRLVWALDAYEDLPAYSAAIRGLHGALRAAVGDTEPPPERLWTPCNSCDALGLARHPGEAYPIQCVLCGHLQTEAEYEQWSKLVASATKRRETV